MRTEIWGWSLVENVGVRSPLPSALWAEILWVSEIARYRGTPHVQGVLTGSQDFVGGQYLEFHTVNSHGNCFYVYLMSRSTLLYVEYPYSDHLHLQTDIRAK
jgi:hypothetical protein